MSAHVRRHVRRRHHRPHLFDVAAIFRVCTRRGLGRPVANPSFTGVRENYSASATDAANLAIDAGVFRVEAERSGASRYGSGDIGDAWLVVTNWGGPDR